MLTAIREAGRYMVATELKALSVRESFWLCRASSNSVLFSSRLSEKSFCKILMVVCRVLSLRNSRILDSYRASKALISKADQKRREKCRSRVTYKTTRFCCLLSDTTDSVTMLQQLPLVVLNFRQSAPTGIHKFHVGKLDAMVCASAGDVQTSV